MNIPATATNTTVAMTDERHLYGMLERYLRDPTIEPNKLEKMVELQERILRWNAETAFNTSMAEAQSEITRIATDKVNPQTRSKYASYAAMDEMIRPIYSRYGLALQFNTDASEQPGHIRIVCDVTKGGHIKRFHIDMPADGKGARGNDVMTRTHATGSAVTYGRRYLLAMIFNVAVGDVDDDGNAAGRMTARARNELIKDDPEACERAADEWGERAGERMIKGMQPDDIVLWGDAEVTSKAQFLLTTRDRIRTETDGQALADWWNSEEQKQARRDFELTRPEFSSLKDFITARLKQLKEGVVAP